MNEIYYKSVSQRADTESVAIIGHKKMDICIDDDNLMDIVNEVFEDVIVEDSSDEEDASSDDSAYNSDDSENLEEDIVERVVPFSELHALNLNTRHCMIQFYYYSIEEPGICASCVIRFRDNEMGVLHETLDTMKLVPLVH